ncbi:MAG: hypothetical protein R3F14_33885 [Polyangiaceae bacterium]
MPDGGLILAGTFSQMLLYNGVDQAPAPEGMDGFVAHLDATRALTWLVRIGGPGNQSVHSMALTSDSAGALSIVVAGVFEQSLVVGDLDTGEKADADDFYVAKLALDGTPAWGLSLAGDPSNLGPGAPTCFVAAGPGGTIHVAGTFTGTVQLGQNIGAVGDRDIFIGKLAPDGTPAWAHSIGEQAGEQRAAGIAVNDDGSSILAGDVKGKAQVDAATTLQSDGTWPDAFLAVYNPEGDVEWARRYGSKAEDHAGTVSVAPGGDLLFTGRFRGAITFGEEPALLNDVAIAYNDDIFLARLTPKGAPLYTTKFGKDKDQIATTVAGTPEGDIYLGGWFSGVVDFGQGDTDAKLGDDLFIVKLAPKSN